MSTFLHSKGSFKSVINDNIIDDINWNAQYDGTNLDVIANNKNKQVFLKLDNNDIEELLKLSSNQETVEKNLRNSLKNDYTFEPIYIENKPIKKKDVLMEQEEIKKQEFVNPKLKHVH